MFISILLLCGAAWISEPRVLWLAAMDSDYLACCLYSCMKQPSIVPPIWTCPRRKILRIPVKLDRRRWLSWPLGWRFMMLAATFHGLYLFLAVKLLLFVCLLRWSSGEKDEDGRGTARKTGQLFMFMNILLLFPRSGRILVVKSLE